MTRNQDLAGKIALVGGSSRGIGKGIAGHLLERGAVVYLTGRSHDSLDLTCGEFRESYPDQVEKFNGDLSDTATISTLLNHIKKERGRIDIVVANIGSGKSQGGWDVPDHYWEESLQVNFFGAVKLSRESLRIMSGQKSGVIIFIASIAGVETIAAPVPYSCAKAALLSYMKNTAPLAGQHGIRMNAISPGNIFFKGGSWDRKCIENPDSVREYIRDQVPLQKFGTPDNIGSLVCYLVSDEASFITGANFIVDGGQTRAL